MTNLLSETLEKLAEHGKTSDDVHWVGDDKRIATWADFAAIADVEYDDGYGSAEVDAIYVVGADWWLERGEYDGSEWWEFKTLPTRPFPGDQLLKVMHD